MGDRRRAWVWAAGALWAALLLAAQPGAAAPPALGQRAPDFAVKDVATQEEIHLADVAGRGLVLLYVWSEVCPFCDDESKGFDEVVAEYRSRGVAALVIVENGDEEEMGVVAALFRPASRLLVAPDRRISGLYGITEHPALIILDRDRTIRFRGSYQGPEPLRRRLDGLLRGRPQGDRHE